MCAEVVNSGSQSTERSAKDTASNLGALRDRILEISKDRQRYLTLPSRNQDKPTSVEDELKKKAGEIENSAREQDIKLKRHTLYALFGFLATETVLIFVFTLFQAIKIFQLDEWSFKLLVAATISQITYMLQVAVKHLFPANEKS